MRVLFYHPARAWSGRARAFGAAARGLAGRGWEVTFVCAPQSAVEERVATAGYEVAPLPANAGWAVRSWRLRRILLERFVEVVFVHTDDEHLVAAAAMRLAGRGAVVRRVGAGGRLAPGPRGRAGRRLATTDVLFTTEADVRPVPWRLDDAPAVADVGVDAEAYDGVRAAARASLGAAGAARLIVCAYDRSGRARAATVLRTLALLAPRHPELRLAILGAGSDDEDLRMHAAALGLTKIVSHLGERDDALAVMRAADLGWVVAGEDNAAFACLDLMALRVPVLAEKGALAQYYVPDGIAGILLPPGDAPTTAAAVASFLAHDEQRTAMGNAGRVRVARDFTEAAMVDGFERAATAARDRSRW